MKLKLVTMAMIIAALCACNNEKKNQQQTGTAETKVRSETLSETKTEQETITTNQKPQTMEQETKKEEPQKVAEVETLKEPVFDVITSMGTIRIKLYNETPKHRDNFIKLVKDNFYNGVIFHRVIKDFMIQVGDPTSKNATQDARLGSGGPGYTIDAEILPQFKHKKGALAAARLGDQINPKKESSGSQFYIVHNASGTPHLDGGYTVFGETLQGLDVVDKIAAAAVRPDDNRPFQDIKIERIVRVE